MKNETNQYFVGNSEAPGPHQGKPTITVAQDLPFSVDRDLLRACGCAQNFGYGVTVYTCLLPENLPEAEKVLRGAMWERGLVCEFADCDRPGTIRAPDDWVYPGALCCEECYRDPFGQPAEVSEEEEG